MILFKMNVKELNKPLEQIVIGDILKRKLDKCYYELKSISFDKQEIAYYHFYGFTIKNIKNMAVHFENDFGKFEIYKEYPLS